MEQRQVRAFIRQAARDNVASLKALIGSDHARGRLRQRQLPDVYIDRAARLLGVSMSTLRQAEASGRIPAPRTKPTGSLQRRLYNYNEINALRAVLNPAIPVKPARPLRLTVSTHKGGVGKSTTALHLAHYAAREGFRVLVVDMDPQASLTTSHGMIPELDLDRTGAGMMDVLCHDPDAIGAVRWRTCWDNLDLLPASLDLSTVDWRLARETPIRVERLGDPAMRLSAALDLLDAEYDIIVIDTGPSLSLLTLNALASADLILMPMEPSIPTFASTGNFFRILSTMLDNFETTPRFRAIRGLFTLVNSGAEHATVRRFVEAVYPQLMLSSLIPHTPELQRASSDLVSLYERTRSRGSHKTLLRAQEAMDQVCHEIFQELRRLAASTPAMEPIAPIAAGTG